MYILTNNDSLEVVKIRKRSMYKNSGDKEYYIRKYPDELARGYLIIHQDNVCVKALTIRGLVRKIRKRYRWLNQIDEVLENGKTNKER